MANSFDALISDLRSASERAVREAAVEIMNDLVEVGPGYTGAFSSSWYCVKSGSEPGPTRNPNGGSLYKYDLRNIPKSKLKDGVFFEIVNSHPQAAIIQDLEPGLFKSQIDENGDIALTVKSPVAIGKRNKNPGMRGDVTSGPGFAISTASQDWYANYAQGGRLRLSLERGVTRGLKSGGRGFQ